jgi:hypothetical protein
MVWLSDLGIKYNLLQLYNNWLHRIYVQVTCLLEKQEADNAYLHCSIRLDTLLYHNNVVLAVDTRYVTTARKLSKGCLITFVVWKPVFVIMILLAFLTERTMCQSWDQTLLEVYIAMNVSKRLYFYDLSDGIYYTPRKLKVDHLSAFKVNFDLDEISSSKV